MKRNILFLAIALACSHVHAQSVGTPYCPAGNTQATIPLNGGAYLSCPATAPPAPAPAPAPPPPPPPPVGGCSAQDTSSLWPNGQRLTRLCTGSATFGGYHPAYTGQVYDGGSPTLKGVWTDTAHAGPFSNYLTGYTMAMPIPSGQYVSIHIHAQTAGQMQFTSDPSYGNAGIITLSTKQGAFTVADGVVSGGYGACIYHYGAANSMWIGTGGADCPMTVGGDYYVNFADVDTNGNPQCFTQGGITTCSKISYQVISGH